MYAFCLPPCLFDHRLSLGGFALQGINFKLWNSVRAGILSEEEGMDFEAGQIDKGKKCKLFVTSHVLMLPIIAGRKSRSAANKIYWF